MQVVVIKLIIISFYTNHFSIIDVSGGAQPIVNPDNGLILCVNGDF